MPSSTSSFEERSIPPGRWAATWVVALVVAALATWRLERVSRSHGQRPSVGDEAILWSLARHTVDNDRRVVAFVGSSRLALGYSQEAFREAAPNLHGVQLAINGAQAQGVLADLAADESFRGIAVVDLLEWDVGVPSAFTAAKPFVDRARTLWRAPSAVANRYLALFAQSRLALLAMGGHHFLTWLVARGSWPSPTYIVSDRDRVMHGDYSLAEPNELQRQRETRVVDFFANIPTPEVWLTTAMNELEPLVLAIRAHGGDVVFVRMPISGVLARDFDRGFPRAAYWDAFAARTSARTIHARDVPALANLTCPDDMHLDQRDQEMFTRRIVEAMRARDVFKGRE